MLIFCYHCGRQDAHMNRTLCSVLCDRCYTAEGTPEPVTLCARETLYDNLMFASH